MAEVVEVTLDDADSGQGVPGTPFADTRTRWWGYKVYFSHAECNEIAQSASVISRLVPDPRIAAALLIVAGGIVAVERVGGRRGVTAIGVWTNPIAPVILPGRHL